MMFGIICTILLLYFFLILILIVGFQKTPTTTLQNAAPTTEFSVIIPYRNEASNLPALLTSIATLNYPRTKVSFWFVDDDSQDNAAEIIEKFCKEHSTINIQQLNNQRVSNSPKKDAIKTAISQIQSDWIVTTDADCVLPENWLLAFDQKINSLHPKMIAAPVTYHEKRSFLNYFQLLDFLSLQGTTISTFGLNIPFMCNGANLAYQKEAFLQVSGYSGNDTIASGDDVFLLEKFIHKFPKKVVYLKSKDALVKTDAVTSLSALISQRVRWASKSTHFTLLRGKIIGMIVMLMNLLFCSIPILLLTVISWKLLLIVIMIKIGVDGVLLFQTLQFTSQKFKPLQVIFSGILYPFFTIFIFIRSLISTYTWKDRTFKK